MKTDPRILIVGAGPTGLTAAVELARRGYLPAVIEKRDGVSNLSRAVGILPRSMDLLAPSGVSAAIAAEAEPIRAVAFHFGARRIADVAIRSDRKLLGLAQDRTEHHLRDALRRYGGDVRFGARLEGLTQTDDMVCAVINGNEERYDYVLGADGVKSSTRAALGLAYDGYELPGRWSIADVHATGWPHAGSFCGYLMKGGHVAVAVPLEATRFRVIADSEDALAALPVPMPVTKIRRQADFTISIRQVTHYQRGRVFLAGDAAHCHSPVGGRGMNLGIADACEFARRMAEGDLEGYHDARHHVGATTIRTTERLRRLLMADTVWARATLRMAFFGISTLPPLRRVFLRRLLDLD